MAIAAYPATLKIGANSIQDIMTFDLPFKMDMADTTAFSGSGGAAVGTKTSIPTLFGMAVKATGSWNKGDTTGQLLLENAFFGRTTVTVIVSPNGTNTYTYTAWISDYDVKGDPKKQVEVDFTMTVNGAVTVA